MIMMFWHVISCNLEPSCDKQISYQLGFYFLPKLWSKNKPKHPTPDRRPNEQLRLTVLDAFEDASNWQKALELQYLGEKSQEHLFFLNVFL